MPKNEPEETKAEMLYQTYRHLMFYVANSILHDDTLAEEAVAQAFTHIADNTDKISEIDSTKTKSFMLIMIKNISLNIYNLKQKSVVISFDELAQWPPVNTRSSVGNDKDFIELVEMLRALPDGYLNTLILKFDNGFSTPEISSLLQVGEEVIQKRIQVSRTKLAELLMRKK